MTKGKRTRKKNKKNDIHNSALTMARAHSPQNKPFSKPPETEEIIMSPKINSSQPAYSLVTPRMDNEPEDTTKLEPPPGYRIDPESERKLDLKSKPKPTYGTEPEAKPQPFPEPNSYKETEKSFHNFANKSIPLILNLKDIPPHICHRLTELGTEANINHSHIGHKKKATSILLEPPFTSVTLLKPEVHQPVVNNQ